MTPKVIILSAPSGAGKTTIARRLLAARQDLDFSVSATTRAARERECDGVDYLFLSRDEFQDRIGADEFLEWAEYSGERYGTLRAEVDRVLRSGRHVLLDIEVQGARTIRERAEGVVSIFILPPSVEALLERLSARRSEPSDVLAARMRRAVEELAEANEYEHIVVNDELARAVTDVARIIDTGESRPGDREGVEALLSELREGLAERASRLAHQ
jgi:guanylate kinase